MKVIIFGLVHELPSLLLQLDQPHREAMQLVGDVAERSAAVRDRPKAQRLDASLEFIIVELRSQVGRLIGRERAVAELRMSHRDLIGATLRARDLRQVSLSSTGS